MGRTITSNHNGMTICNLCWPNLILYGDIFPEADDGQGSDYYLAYRPLDDASEARTDHVEPKAWPLGYWAVHDIGLGQGHDDPLFVWRTRPIINPLANITDDELDEFQDDNPIWSRDAEFDRIADEIEKAWEGGGPLWGYYLVRDCIAGGWPQRGSLSNWLVDRLAHLIERKEQEWTASGLPLGGNQAEEPECRGLPPEPPQIYQI